MNGNNSWQRMGQFARFPRHDLGPIAQPQPLPSRELVSMGQLVGGGGDPFQEGMPIPAIPQQQDYDEGRPPIGKKILGMPKDRFIALMGSIAQAFGGDSASGRMGASLVNMADIMHGERMEQGERQAAETKARREAKTKTAKEKRTAAEKKKGKAPTVRTFRVGDMDVQHSFNYDTRQWEPIAGMPGKKVKEVEGEKKAPAVRTFRVGDMDVQHAWDTDTGKWKTIPGMPGKKIKPPAGEKPLTPAEKRAQAKELRKAESAILNPENLEYPETQVDIDFFNENSKKPYVFHRTPGEVVDWGRNVPTTIEKIDVSTAEKIKVSKISRELKLHLLKTRFGYD